MLCKKSRNGEISLVNSVLDTSENAIKDAANALNDRDAVTMDC